MLNRMQAPPATVTNTCVMTFATSRGTRKNVGINNSFTAIAPASVRDAADRFLAVNPFDSTVGDLTRLIRAEVVSRSVTTVLMPEDDA